MSKSAGEEELAFQLIALGVPFEREYRWCEGRKWRADFWLTGTRWLLEVDGGVWGGGHRRFDATNADCERANAAQLLGWRVLRFTPYLVETGDAIETIEAALHTP